MASITPFQSFRSNANVEWQSLPLTAAGLNMFFRRVRTKGVQVASDHFVPSEESSLVGRMGKGSAEQLRQLLCNYP